MNESYKTKVEHLTRSIRRFTDVVNSFPADKRELKLFGEFSLRDIVAHFSGWNLATIEALTSAQNSEEYDGWFTGEDEEFNEIVIAERKERRWDELYGELITSFDELVAKYGSLSETQAKILYSETIGYSPNDSISVDIDHIREHLEQIKEYI